MSNSYVMIARGKKAESMRNDKREADNCILCAQRGKERSQSDTISIMHIKYDVEILGIFRLSVCVMEMRAGASSKESSAGDAYWISPLCFACCCAGADQPK
jgi:hypothetical protein